jgi:DNA-directed RNA polymerase beta' subunit
MNWEFQAATDFRRWSFGEVRTVRDLYAQPIFGPKRDLACECGKYADDPAVDGMICDECGVRVSRDARRLRSTRLGHVELACPCQHPLGDEDPPVESFPIAPIASRL